jgi:hypothetical protein
MRAFHCSSVSSSTSGWLALNAWPSAGRISKRALQLNAIRRRPVSPAAACRASFWASSSSSSSEADLAGSPQEKLRAELALEQVDRVAQRRLRHVQALGRTSEVQILGDRHEVAQVTKL